MNSPQKESLHLTRVPIAETGMLIRKPVAEVFEAIVNLEITTKFWFTSSGRLAVGRPVRWDWQMYDVSIEVTAKAIDINRRSVVEWPGYSGPTTVEWTFAPLDDGKTFVRVTESGFTGTGVGDRYPKGVDEHELTKGQRGTGRRQADVRQASVDHGGTPRLGPRVAAGGRSEMSQAIPRACHMIVPPAGHQSGARAFNAAPPTMQGLPEYSYSTGGDNRAREDGDVPPLCSCSPAGVRRESNRTHVPLSADRQTQSLQPGR